MNKRRPILLWIAAAAALAVVGVLALAQSAKTQQANERAIAQAAILGRWSVTLPGGVRRSFLLDFPAHGTPTCAYGGPGAPPRAAVRFAIRQTPLRARMLDNIRHQPAPPYFYFIWISGGPAASPAGQPWQGHLIGDGNILVLTPSPSGVPSVLRRLGSG